jgi:hypothetical protein
MGDGSQKRVDAAKAMNIQGQRTWHAAPPKPHRGHEAGGAGSLGAISASNGDSTALMAAKIQSFLDNVIAEFARS